MEQKEWNRHTQYSWKDIGKSEIVSYVFICNCFFVLFQVVLNTGGDQYQTVTIVPSDGNTGEVCKITFLIFNLFSNFWFISNSKCSNWG